jgi:molecular chaperone GrpE
MPEPIEAEPQEEMSFPEVFDDDTPSAEALSAATEESDLVLLLAKVEDYKNALQRERADFQNFRKRTERDNEALRARLNSEILLKFLPVVDDFERAIEAIPAEERQSEMLKGFHLILRKLQSILETEGIKSIYPLGQPFDPNFHEVIGMDESGDYDSQHVSAVLQKGYLHGDKVLRPAMVRVAN